MTPHDPALPNVINKLIDLFETDTGEHVHRSLQQLVQAGNAHFGNVPPCSSCRSADCCFIPTQTFFLEMWPAARRIRLEGKDSPQFRTWLRRRGELQESYSHNEWFRMQQPCPLLRDKRCTVYEQRPLCCSSYFAWNGPDVCSVKNTTVLVGRIEATGLIASMAFHCTQVAKDVLRCDLEDRLPVGSIGRMTALALEIFASDESPADHLQREPFPSLDNHESWLGGNNPFRDQRLARQAQQP